MNPEEETYEDGLDDAPENPPEDDLEAILEPDPSESTEGNNPRPDDVGAASLEDAMNILRANGFEPVPSQLLTHEQAVASAQAVDYAQAIPIPDDVYAQGPEAVENYRAFAAAEITTQRAMAPMQDTAAATAIASVLNRPDMAESLNATLTQELGPGWNAAMGDPKTKSIVDWMVKGILADSPVQRKDAVPVPAAVAAGRPGPMGGKTHPLDGNGSLQKIAAEYGLTVADLLEEN